MGRELEDDLEKKKRTEPMEKRTIADNIGMATGSSRNPIRHDNK